MLRSLYIFFLLIGPPLSLSAQTNNVMQDSVERKIKVYSAGNKSSVLFVHFDKTVYANNENVWFTGYLLNAEDASMYNTMSVAMVNDLDRTVVLESRCVMTNGIAFGKAVIPDSAPPGNYTFIVITNLLKNKQPDIVYKAPVTIRSANEPEFVATLSAVDTSVSLAQQKVMLNVNFNNLPSSLKKGVPAPEFQINYYVGDASRPVVKGFGKTKGGVYNFSIPSVALIEGNSKLSAQVWYQNKSTELSINLPARKLKPTIKFYPEGGNLVSNLQSRVGWQAKTATGAPLGVTGFLYKNNTVIDTITTDANGGGVFDLTPLAGTTYSIKLYGHTDTVYSLPQPIDRSPILSLQNGLVNDTLLVTIKSLQNQKVYLIGHNFNEVFFNTPVTLQPGYKRLAFVLRDVPAGISQLILLDSTGRRLADRLFFSHYGTRPIVNITTDKPQYATRQKVTVKLKLSSPDAEQADVSVAGVQANRVAANTANNIADYFYWKNKLPDVLLPDDHSLQSKAAKEQLEAQLLVNTWGRYNDTDVITVVPTGLAPQYSDIAFTGRVTYLGKALTKPVTLFNTANPSRLVTTDNAGKFVLVNDDLKTDSAAQLIFMVSDDDAKNYGIYLSDAYSTNNQQLAAGLAPHSLKNAQGSTQYLYLPDKKHAIKLKEVNIKAQKDDQFYGTLGGAEINNQSSTSFKGSIRNGDGTVTNFTNVLIFKDQKQKYVLRVNGIQQKMPTFKIDLAPITEPQYLSTLFWKHQQKLLPGIETEITFYTSDITGDFKIIVQGKTASSVVYGKTSLNVIK
nr:hypothetical protein [uncultured Mucilaginibacter sp.]